MGFDSTGVVPCLAAKRCLVLFLDSVSVLFLRRWSNSALQGLSWLAAGGEAFVVWWAVC